MTLALALILVSGAPRGEASVTFRVSAPVPDDRPLTVVGSLPQLGRWEHAGALVLRREDGTWSGAIRVPVGASFSFRITRGDWSREAVDDRGRLVPDRWVQVRADTVLNLSVHGWEDMARMRADFSPLEPMRDPRSGLERQVWVRVPPAELAPPGHRCPVLYVHDGSSVVTHGSPFGIPSDLVDVADSLCRQGLIPPLIVVAIGSTHQRAQEYGDTVLGRWYQQFVVSELKPRIDAAFPTSPLPHTTAAMGWSLAGLAALLSCCWYPQVFGQAACLDPVVVWGDEKVARTLDVEPGVPLRLFMWMGEGEWEAAMRDPLHRVASRLRERGVEVQLHGGGRGPRVPREVMAKSLVFLFSKSNRAQRGS